MENWENPTLESKIGKHDSKEAILFYSFCQIRPALVP